MLTHRELGVGVGLRSPHIAQVLAENPDVDWLEVHSENFFNPHSQERQQLREIAQHYPISCHGVGLSLGSVDPINPHHLTQLKHLIDEIAPTAVSDHLSWSSVNGQFFNDLLPLPYTEEALVVFCQHVTEVQDYLGRQLLIENPSSYLSFTHSSIPEWEFLREVEQRTGCGLLLDLNNIHVSAFNHGFDSHQYLAAIRPEVVQEIHLAGFVKKQLPEGEVWIDTHSRPVSDPVWQLYRQWIEQHGRVATLIEWDSDIPDLEVLLDEARKAESIIKQEKQDGRHR